jgi:hypothetical protein
MHILVVVAAAALLLIGQSAIAGQGEESQQRAGRAPEGQALKIEIGQRVDDVQKALRERGVETGPGFAISSKNEDDAHFAYFFDEELFSAAIFYSKSRRNITGISIVVRPKGRGKGYPFTPRVIVLVVGGGLGRLGWFC